MSAIIKGEPRQRETPYRKKAYLKYVAKQPCMACGWALPNEVGTICQAAHIRTGYFGIADKPDDWFTIPLCCACHTMFGAGERRFSRVYLDTPIDELKDYAKARWLEWAGHNSVAVETGENDG